MDDAIRAFFDAYTARFNRALADPAADDAEAAAAAFAEYFVEASPAGVVGGPNGARLRELVPQSNAFYRAIGTKSLAYRAIALTPIDAMHGLARVSWEADYLRADGTPLRLPFEVVYLLQLRADGPRIVAYVTGDEQAALRAHGLLPDAG